MRGDILNFETNSDEPLLPPMRPYDRLSPNKEKIPNNSFYAVLQKHIINIIKETPPFSSNKLHVIDGKIQYNIDAIEMDYFERYLIFKPIGLEKLPQVGQLFNIEDLPRGKISESELDIIDFITNRPSQIMFCLGNVGWGKTTLLRHFFFYLLTRYSNSKGKKIIPVYLDLKKVNHRLIAATRNNDIETLVSILDNNMIKSSVGRLCNYFLLAKSDHDSGETWDYIADVCDPDLKFMYETAETIGDLSISDYKSSMAKFKQEYIKNGNAYYFTLRYLKEIMGYDIIMIVDNADPLPAELVDFIIKYTHRKCEENGFRAIIPLRPNTFNEITGRPDMLADQYANFRFYVPRPDPTQILLNGLDTLKDGLKSEGKNGNNAIETEYIKVSFSDMIELSRILINLLMSGGVREFFDHVSNGDLDMWAHLLKVYAQSGYHNDSKSVASIIKNKGYRTTDYSDYFPQWIAYASIITHNHRCYFSDSKIDKPKDTIINLFSNRKYVVNNQLIRLHILNYFSKEHHSVKQMKSLYCRLFNISENIIEPSSNFAIMRLNNCGLISSPNIHKISSYSDVNEVENFEITEAGHYYLKNLLFRYEYISYMKDGCIVNEGHFFKNMSEVKSRGETYSSVHDFIRYLFYQELRWYGKCKCKNLKNLIQYFIPRGTFVSRMLADEMIKYAHNSYISYDDSFTDEHVDMFEQLINDIDEADSELCN